MRGRNLLLNLDLLESTSRLHARMYAFSANVGETRHGTAACIFRKMAIARLTLERPSELTTRMSTSHRTLAPNFIDCAMTMMMMMVHYCSSKESPLPIAHMKPKRTANTRLYSVRLSSFGLFLCLYGSGRWP